MLTDPMTRPAAAADLAKVCPPARLHLLGTLRPRTYHLVDIENQLGGPAEFGVASMSEIPADAYRLVSIQYQKTWVRGDDLVWAACDASRAIEVKGAWPAGQLRCGRGDDGADRALTTVFDAAAAARGCGRLIIASGDHWFCDTARQARAAGLIVEIVAWRGSLARELAELADRVYLHESPQANAA